MEEKGNMITYETLFNLLRIERNKPELQKLDENFLNQVSSYLEEKQNILKSQESKDSVFAKAEVEKTKKQLEQIKKLLKELYEKRESKILNLALISSRNSEEDEDTSAMLLEEKEFYKVFVKELSLFRSSILDKVINKEKTTKILKDESNDVKMIRILETIPKFVGTDLNIYGPFDKEDIANLPEDVAELLIKNDRAEEVKN